MNPFFEMARYFGPYAAQFLAAAQPVIGWCRAPLV